MVARILPSPAFTRTRAQSRAGDSSIGPRNPNVPVRDSRCRVASEAFSHSRRTATRAAGVALKVSLAKSSCRSSMSRRRIVASRTSESSRPRRDRAQSTLPSGSGVGSPCEQRRTASAARAGSRVPLPSEWPVVALPPFGFRSSGPVDRIRWTAAESSRGSLSTGTVAAIRAVAITITAVYSIRALPRSTGTCLAPSGPREPVRAGGRCAGTARGGTGSGRTRGARPCRGVRTGEIRPPRGPTRAVRPPAGRGRGVHVRLGGGERPCSQVGAAAPVRQGGTGSCGKPAAGPASGRGPRGATSWGRDPPRGGCGRCGSGCCCPGRPSTS